MYGSVFYITHPEVILDPGVPVPRWGLSDLGRKRMQALAALPVFSGVQAIWASAEQKALDGAAILGQHLKLAPDCDSELGENDRSATGFVPEPAFSDLADAFFANPDESVQGWETATAAQSRITAAVTRCLATSPMGDVAFIGHGGVGALLYCHIAGLPIARGHHPFGAWFAFDRASTTLTHGWTPPPSPNASP